MDKNPSELAGTTQTVSVEEAAAVLGIGRGLAYQLARTGQLPGVLRLGRRLVVSRRALEAALQTAGTPTTGVLGE